MVDRNTPESGAQDGKKFKIAAPIGYDAHVDGSRVSVTMTRFGTGGTPWLIVIDKKGRVRFNEVTPKSPGAVGELIDELRAEE